MLSDPLISCIMPTYNRREFLPMALGCFANQTWRQRELIVLDDGTDPVEDLCRGIPKVDYVRLAQRYTVGSKRNIGCSRARGEIICHWDDDNWSHMCRIEYQYGRLLSTGKACHGFNKMRFLDDTTWWEYSGLPHYILGTSMMYWRHAWEEHPFADVNVGEDKFFADACVAIGGLATEDAGEMMWARTHAGNTSPRQTGGKLWRQIAA